MSDSRKLFAKSRLLPSSYPKLPSFNENDHEKKKNSEETLELQSCQINETKGIDKRNDDDDNNDSWSESSISSMSTIKPVSGQDSESITNRSEKKKRNLEPISWNLFFERELFLKAETKSMCITYHAYYTSQVGTGPLFVMHHGAGSSGLSFAALSKEIRNQLPSAGILAVDARGHGLTQIDSLQETVDFSLATLSEDLLLVINKTKLTLGWKETPPLVLIGHSLGGAVITEIAKNGTLGESLLCYAVLDVVEGSAIDSIKSMHAYLLSRPVNFTSLESAIEWHIRTRTIRNSTSARTSVPALLKQTEAFNCWTWRTDLTATQPFWESWFVGMSQKFLDGKAGKMLLLAGTDRLDTTLMIGQMQGKYALQIFPEAGHFIHEDLPAKTAMVIADFYNRNDRSTMVLPPKMADIMQAKHRV